MNKTLLSAALVAVTAATAFAPTAQAADGTINITGKVMNTSCTVAITGTNGQTVVLPPVLKSALATANATAGDTSFNVGLSGCDPIATSATMKFSGSNINSNGNLTNATGPTYSSAQVRLLNGSSAVINTFSQSNAPVIAIQSDGTGSVAMKAQYFAAAANTTAGLVSTSVDFTLTYL